MKTSICAVLALVAAFTVVGAGCKQSAPEAVGAGNGAPVPTSAPEPVRQLDTTVDAREVPQLLVRIHQRRSLYQHGASWDVWCNGEVIRSTVSGQWEWVSDLDSTTAGLEMPSSATVSSKFSSEPDTRDWYGKENPTIGTAEWMSFDPDWSYEGAVLTTGEETLVVGSEEWPCSRTLYQVDSQNHKLWISPRFGPWLPARLDIDGRTVMRLQAFHSAWSLRNSRR
ncbi:MAG: hypothetical protein KDB90_01870 [Planctomycetes bacterium]|nr:hypothetical protein [Planctomycetota bacterium]